MTSPRDLFVYFCEQLPPPGKELATIKVYCQTPYTKKAKVARVEPDKVLFLVTATLQHFHEHLFKTTRHLQFSFS